jgi:DNA methylase
VTDKKRQRPLTGEPSAAQFGERLALSALTSDPRQIRRHTEKNLTMIGDGLRAVGAARSIVLDEDNAILAGNGTIEAAAKAGFSKVRVIEADGTEIIAVRRRGLTEKQKVELALYDNRSSDFAEYDGEALARVTDLVGLDAELFFSGAERAALLGLEPDAKTGLTDPDEVPAVRATTIKPGDLFALGPHRIMCGDCTDRAVVARVLGGAGAAFAFTSPPYLDQRAYGGGDQSTETLATFLEVAAAEGVKLFAVNLGIVRRGAAIVPHWDHYTAAAVRAGLKLVSWNVWYQGANASIGRLTAMFPIEHEFILVYGPGTVALRKHVPNKTAGEVHHPTDRQSDGRLVKKPPVLIAPHRALGTVLELSSNQADDLTRAHPARFPVALVIPYLQACTTVGALVYEPFCGSGSTLIAAEQTDRAARCIELHPPYVQLAIDRWEAFTGQKAALISEPKTGSRVRAAQRPAAARKKRR